VVGCDVSEVGSEAGGFVWKVGLSEGLADGCDDGFVWVVVGWLKSRCRGRTCGVVVLML